MLYCFSDDLLKCPTSDNDSWLQYQYAAELHCACSLDFAGGVIRNQLQQEIDVTGERIFLRTTSDHLQKAMLLISRSGGLPLEGPQDIDKIQRWFTYLQPKRRILLFPSSRELFVASNNRSIEWLSYADQVFIKTKRKGYSSVILAHLLTSELYWSKMNGAGIIRRDEEIIVSQYLSILRDNLGPNEWRFFVLDGTVRNASRYIHTLKHCVPNEVWTAASEYARQFSEFSGFPKNYVLDLMETAVGCYDIVELNPISSSMCYVNNSIFTTQLPRIGSVCRDMGFGFEFCLDALRYPDHYRREPVAGESYQYQRQ